MTSLIQFFAAIAGSIREKNDITRPLLNGYLSEIRFELRRKCSNYWWKKDLPAYCHFRYQVEYSFGWDSLSIQDDFLSTRL